jgi:hypothetical protein
MKADKINIWGHKKRNGVWRMRELIKQIKSDQRDGSLMWERVNNGVKETEDEEALSRAMAWLKMDLDAYRQLRQDGIEDTYWSEIGRIEKEVATIEEELRIRKHKS